MSVIMSVANSVDTSYLGASTGFLIPSKPAGVVAGTWAFSNNIAFRYGAALQNSTTHANGDECYTYIVLAQGTYTLLDSPAYTDSTSGKVDIYLDAVKIATDDYCTGAGSVCTVLETAGIVVSAAKIYKLTFKVNGKNAGSSNYYAYIGSLHFVKTG